MSLAQYFDPVDDFDPQDCEACIAAGDLCGYHEGFADGWDRLALILAELAEAQR